ncbi:MAG: zeta toxin family protein [Gemmatimonadaceae bacterium]
MLAGVNGAGKSSVAGAAVSAAGGEYFNPDEVARRILVANPGVTSAEANATAWVVGRRLLERAIADGLDYAFETTLGGTTITRLLVKALDGGREVHVRYVGLEGVELHIERVRARVASGGHDIPEAKIRERYDSSRRNLIRLLPVLTGLSVFDNSYTALPLLGGRPRLQLVLQVELGAVRQVAPLETVPEWAKAIVMAAINGSPLSRG